MMRMQPFKTVAQNLFFSQYMHWNLFSFFSHTSNEFCNFTSITNLTEKVTFTKNNMRSHQSKVPILTLLCQIEKIPHSSIEDLYLIPHTKQTL